MSGFDVSAFTDEDGIVHVTITEDGREYRVQGHPTVTIGQKLATVDGRLGAPYHVVAPEHFRLELVLVQASVRTVPMRPEAEG